HDYEVRGGGVVVVLGADLWYGSELVVNVVELGLDRVPRTAGAVAIAPRVAVLRVGVATLDHEAGDHSMKGRAVVEPLADEVREVLDVAGGLVREELDLHLAEAGLDDGA